MAPLSENAGMARTEGGECEGAGLGGRGQAPLLQTFICAFPGAIRHKMVCDGGLGPHADGERLDG